MLIFEGPDGSGKSTLIKNLGLVATHTGGKTTSPEHFFFSMKAMLPGDVYDRCPAISHRIYGLVFDGKTQVPISQMDIWLGLLAKPYVVYCKPDTYDIDVTPKDYKPKDHIDTVVAKAEMVRRLYDITMWELSMKGLIKLVQFNWQRDSLDDLKAVLTKEMPYVWPNDNT